MVETYSYASEKVGKRIQGGKGEHHAISVEMKGYDERQR